MADAEEKRLHTLSIYPPRPVAFWFSIHRVFPWNWGRWGKYRAHSDLTLTDKSLHWDYGWLGFYGILSRSQRKSLALEAIESIDHDVRGKLLSFAMAIMLFAATLFVLAIWIAFAISNGASLYYLSYLGCGVTTVIFFIVLFLALVGFPMFIHKIDVESHDQEMTDPSRTPRVAFWFYASPFLIVDAQKEFDRKSIRKNHKAMAVCSALILTGAISFVLWNNENSALLLGLIAGGLLLAGIAFRKLTKSSSVSGERFSPSKHVALWILNLSSFYTLLATLCVLTSNLMFFMILIYPENYAMSQIWWYPVTYSFTGFLGLFFFAFLASFPVGLLGVELGLILKLAIARLYMVRIHCRHRVYEFRIKAKATWIFDDSHLGSSTIGYLLARHFPDYRKQLVSGLTVADLEEFLKSIHIARGKRLKSLHLQTKQTK